MMKKIIFYFFILMGLSCRAWADAITFEASVNSPRISLDEVLQLTLTFTGINQDLDPISLPVLDGFTAKYVGPSTSVTIINGDYHSERSLVYNLFPNKIGHFQIPSISATIAGQTYTSKPIDVEVLQDTSQAPASGGAPDQSQSSETENIKDKIMLIATIDKTDVYVNERVPLKIKLLYAVPMRDIQYPQIDKTGVEVDDYEKPQQGTQLVNGVKYDGVEFETNIYPEHLGDFTFGPVQIQGNVLYKANQSNPFNQDNNAFGADIFNNFFDSYINRPVTVNSQPIQLHVSALPKENRPADFSGAIGDSFDFQASVSPQKVKAGDPITLKMEITGNGNFKNLKMPEFHVDGFKSYQPQIKNSGDKKTLEEVIIPVSANIKEVPVLRFSYFDTSIKDYKSIVQGPFPIQVTAPSPEQEFKAVGFTDMSHEPSAMPVNQFTWGKVFGGMSAFIKKLCTLIWFWVSLGIIVAAGIAYFLWRAFQERLVNDPAFARKLKAVRQARQALMPAEGYISTGKQKEFYALLSKVLRDYLANKWHQTSAALSVDDIVSQLNSAKINEVDVLRAKTLLEECDMVCFAGSAFDASKMRADLSQIQDLIAHLEKQLK